LLFPLSLSQPNPVFNFEDVKGNFEKRKKKKKKESSFEEWENKSEK